MSIEIQLTREPIGTDTARLQLGEHGVMKGLVPRDDLGQVTVAVDRRKHRVVRAGEVAAEVEKTRGR